MTDEMVGWYHQLNGHELEQTPGDSKGQGSLECCSPRGRKSHAQLSNTTVTRWNKAEVVLKASGFLQEGNLMFKVDVTLKAAL